MTGEFIVRVNIKDSYMYWTLSGGTVDIEKAHVFTEETVPTFFQQSLEQPYVQRVPV